MKFSYRKYLGQFPGSDDFSPDSSPRFDNGDRWDLSMRQIGDIIESIRHFSFDKSASQRLLQLATEIETNSQGSQALPEILLLFERFPDEEFGLPGPLAHVAETYYGKGYENALLESLNRKPTPLTLWLANRIVNANDANSAIFLDMLRKIAFRSDLDSGLIEEAVRFVQLHQ